MSKPIKKLFLLDSNIQRISMAEKLSPLLHWLFIKNLSNISKAKL